MKQLKLYVCALFLACLAAPIAASAAPRDADAVLNRCGKPLKGDETDLSNTTSERILKYERGTLYFTRVGNDGWSFLSGAHKNDRNLGADDMAKFMPCLTLALADSAGPKPIPKVTAIQRVEVDVKGSIRTIVIAAAVFLVLLGLLFFILSKRKPDNDDLVG